MTFVVASKPTGLTADVPVVGAHFEDPTTLFKTVARRGFTPIWSSELADALAGRRGLPPQPVMLTFDDGDANWITQLHPAAVAYNTKCNLAVVSDYLYGVTGLNGLSRTAMTWGNARTMQATGLYEWLNHSQDHVDGFGSTSGQRLASLQNCNDAIVAELTVPIPRAVVYPQNAYGSGLHADMRTMGLELGLAGSPDRSNRFPGQHPFIVNRTDITVNLLWAKQDVIRDFGHDMAGSRNASNVLGYWTLPGQAALSAEGALTITATSTQAARSLITTDYFHVESPRLYSRALVTGTNQSAGTARVSIQQYDAAQAALTRIDIASLSANLAQTTYDADYTLDANARFVRLEVATDATYNGVITVDRWQARVV